MQKVFVGLSGGVDSAVSAALLQRAGYDVVGVFIKIWQPTFLECTWEKDRIDAMRVAVHLDISFREIDLSAEYKRAVIEEMIDSYKNGFTPNPDIACNEFVKFGSFYDWARKQGADYVATGHYARTQERSGEYVLLRGVDDEKDQSYFLYRIPKNNLASVLFPVGGFTKREVREMARDFGLPVATKHDSQGLCFVGDVSMRDFLSRYIALTEGEVVLENGTVVGKHDGSALYTIGQRHGFELFNTTAESKPYFVTDIDAASNTLVVSATRNDAAVKKIALESVHWLTETSLPIRAEGQSRYREEPFSVHIDEGGTVATFDTPHTISPGQSLVIYQGDLCLGGARMKESCA